MAICLSFLLKFKSLLLITSPKTDGEQGGIVMCRLSWLLFLLGMVGLIGCHKNDNNKTITIELKQQGEEPIAEVGGKILTLDSMAKDFISRQGNFRGAEQFNNEKYKKDYIEDRVLEQAMFLEAIELGYFDKVELQRDIKKLVIQRLMRDKLKEAQESFSPTEEEIKEHYGSNKNLYNRTEAIKMGYISVSSADKKAAQKIAKEIYEKANSRVKNGNKNEFNKLFSEYSKAYKDNRNIVVEGREIEYMEHDEFDKEFGKGAFSKLKSVDKTGAIGPVLVNKEIFYVPMKTGYRKEVNESIADAKERIVKRLANDYRGEFYKIFTDGLRDKYKIKIYEDLIPRIGEKEKIGLR